ncbi:MAG: hypothetical protein RL328_1902 [Acidobacteriota bacterium]
MSTLTNKRSVAWLAWLAVAPCWGAWPDNLQFHGFVSQGYAVSDHNNYLTMNTSQGTAKFSDGALNLTWKVNDRLRLGSQVYSRAIGDLGKGRVALDWAVVDFRFRDWLGIRAGKVKTPLGLFNDAQDQEFLYTWALLPQAAYPLDLRETTNAHVGGDLYGSIDLKKRGFVTYQAYAGRVPTDYRSGFLYGIEDSGFTNVSYSARTAGYDVRWTTPVTGLFAGFSQAFLHRKFWGQLVGDPEPGSADNYFNRQSVVYMEFARGGWRFDGEYRFAKALTRIPGLPGELGRNGQKTPGWFTALSYRFSKLVEVGSYRSQYTFTDLFHPISVVTGPGANHVDDTTVALRLDPKPYWNVKVEDHFIDGFGNPVSARGFYPRYHPQGMNPKTNLLVLRTGWVF